MNLAPEIELLPENLFQNLPPTDDREWWLIHTLPRQEKALAREIAKVQIPFYLPCTPRRTKVRNQVLIARIPLFSGYVFGRLNNDDRQIVYTGRRVARMSRVVDQERLWDDLKGVRQLLDLGRPITTESKLEPGTPIVVRTGPLTGMKGTIVKAAGALKFVIRVNLIERGISVTVDSSMLGRIDDA
jgi:transcriptional antiterminator RfaH